MVGRLEMYVGSMYAEKSTNLIRQGKRHMLAGRKVVFIKPAIDNRYSQEAVMTHDGVEFEAILVEVFEKDKIRIVWESREELNKKIDELENADVICIDEVQFLPKTMITFINNLVYIGKKVYVAGLDMDRFGKPFGIVPHLMAIAEKVTKVHAVCKSCGDDAWRTIGTDGLNNNNQINVGNDYVPVCRGCVNKYGRY